MVSERSFPLIELLVAGAILGILVTIALPYFASYRKQANDSLTENQRRKFAVAMDAYFLKNNKYTMNIGDLTEFGYKAANNIVVSSPLAGATRSISSSWRATAYHNVGNTTYVWGSGSSGKQ